MHTEHNNHPEGLNMLLTCKIFPGRPVLGSWITYALGTENQNLPAYVVLRDPAGYSDGGKHALVQRLAAGAVPGRRIQLGRNRRCITCSPSGRCRPVCNGERLEICWPS